MFKEGMLYPENERLENCISNNLVLICFLELAYVECKLYKNTVKKESLFSKHLQI